MIDKLPVIQETQTLESVTLAQRPRFKQQLDDFKVTAQTGLPSKSEPISSKDGREATDQDQRRVVEVIPRIDVDSKKD